jgi:hypothetical protein
MPTPREKFEERIRRLEEEKLEYARDMNELERLLAKYDLTVIASPTEDDAPPEKKFSNVVLAAREAEGIIRASGHPVALNELFKIITIDRGMEITGNHPPSTLTAALSTARKLQYLKDYGWWIRGVPWPMTSEETTKFKSGSFDNEWTEPVRTRAPGKVGPQQTAEKKALFEGVRSILHGRAEPMIFAEIFDRLKDAGLTAGGQNERKNLAVFLSKFSCFVSDGRKRGWRYVPERDFTREDEEIKTVNYD